MTHYKTGLLFSLVIFLLTVDACAQTTDSTSVFHKKSTKSNYTNEFFMSGGVNYCTYRFMDAGLRYYRWKNDGQTVMAFAGASAGCEFSLGPANQVYIPYIGWQGQFVMLAYGMRIEYILTSEKEMYASSVEMGLSLFEFIRITGGYRFTTGKNDPLALGGFRFSAIAAFPVSFLKKTPPVKQE
ncbi:MAG TPA: hypothetical protein VK177_10665 [Flavobacteriales bacterium]|nr:hypothetical protein [Flavobacteriales bacterium]